MSPTLRLFVMGYNFVYNLKDRPVFDSCLTLLLRNGLQRLADMLHQWQMRA